MIVVVYLVVVALAIAAARWTYTRYVGALNRKNERLAIRIVNETPPPQREQVRQAMRMLLEAQGCNPDAVGPADRRRGNETTV